MTHTSVPVLSPATSNHSSVPGVDGILFMSEEPSELASTMAPRAGGWSGVGPSGTTPLGATGSVGVGVGVGAGVGEGVGVGVGVGEAVGVDVYDAVIPGCVLMGNTKVAGALFAPREPALVGVGQEHAVRPRPSSMASSTFTPAPAASSTAVAPTAIHRTHSTEHKVK